MGRNKTCLFNVPLFFLNILPSTTHSTIILGYYKQKLVKNWVGKRLSGILTISLSNFIIPNGFMIFYCMLFVSNLMIELLISMFNYFIFKHPFVFLRFSHFYSLLVTRRGSRIKRFLCLLPHQLFSKESWYT